PHTLFALLLHPHPSPTPFPYTTLFRSYQPANRPESLGHIRRRWNVQHQSAADRQLFGSGRGIGVRRGRQVAAGIADQLPSARGLDRKSTRLNSSHSQSSYAVFCLKKKICLSDCGLNGSRKPLFSPAVSKRRSTPSLSIRPVKPKPSISTPTEPTMLALLTRILSAAAAM